MSFSPYAKAITRQRSTTTALLDDRDLATFCTRLEGDLETQDAPVTLNWAGSPVSVGRITQTEVAARFGFIPEPSL